MNKIQGHVLAILSLLAITGCSEASDLEKRADKAQLNADEKIADLRSESSQDIREAQAEADKKIAVAAAEFSTMRENYRHETAVKLDVMDKKVALDARLVGLKGVAKADLQAKLNLIQASRSVFMDDYKLLDGATGATWDGTKARLDREWADLSALVDAA